jgi:hypothetical protein
MSEIPFAAPKMGVRALKEKRRIFQYCRELNPTQNVDSRRSSAAFTSGHSAASTEK